nr:HPr-rel-A system PqqD family peptide chaperone [Sphingomonas aerophila]
MAEPIDAFTAVYHRPSGQTHLLVEPAPEILDALGRDGLTLAKLRAALAERYDLTEADDLAERLEELVAAGLVSAA